MRKGVCNVIANTRDMNNTNIYVVLYSTIIQQTHQSHCVSGTSAAPLPNVYNGQVWTANMMANNSFQVISISHWAGDQWDCNHLPSQYAPQPCSPEAVGVELVKRVHLLFNLSNFPGHLGKRSNHYWISSLVSDARLMWWWRFDTLVLRSIILCKKICPAGSIYLAAEQQVSNKGK